MIEKYKRKLREEERKSIENDSSSRMKFVQSEVSIYKKSFLILPIVSLIGLILISIFSINNFWGKVGGVITIYSILFLWICISEFIKNKKRIQSMSTFVKNLFKYKVEVIHCKSNKAIMFQEWEDLGVYFVFQAEPNKMFFLGGQEYAELRKLPNSDFEVVIGMEKDYCYLWKIFVKGKKLKPVRIISPEEVKKLYKKGKHFDDLKIIEGKIDNFENGI